jgi:hypothetical protein
MTTDENELWSMVYLACMVAQAMKVGKPADQADIEAREYANRAVKTVKEKGPHGQHS